MTRNNNKSKSPLGALLESLVPEEKKSQGSAQKIHSAHSRHPQRKSTGAGQSGTQRSRRSGTFQYSKFGNKKPSRPADSYKNRKTGSDESTNKALLVPKPEEGVVRIIPLGGVEEIGKNMTAIEIGNDIIVIDAGMHFSTEDTPGIDYVIPNTRYLEERKDRIRAMIVTHGHLDHIGGIPLVMDRIGNPPLYSRNLSILMMLKRQAEFPHLPALNTVTVEKNQSIMCGDVKVRFFGVTHTIPDSMGIIIETPHGLIVTPGDYKLDQIDGVATESEEKEYSIFDNEKVLLLMTDSTNIENEGFALPEIKVHQGLENLIKKIQGRLIIAAFASHLSRLSKIIEVAESLNKKVVLEGRSMKSNIEVIIEAGLLKVQKHTLISIDEIDKYPPNKILILMTGAQGEEFAALNRAANKSHKKFSLKKGDTIILSASIIPGNERSVQKMKDGLSRQGVKIISYRTPGEDFVHATGHGNKEDIKWLHKKTHPKFFIPIHGYHYHLELHKELAMEVGMPEENIVVPDNGSMIEIINNGEKIIVRKEKAPSGPMMVDGFTVGDEQDVVIRDRQMLAEDGMFVIVATVDLSTGKLKKSPDIISRGFVYLKESQDLLHQSRQIIKKTIEDSARGMNPINFEYVKTQLGDSLSKFLYQKTAKRPLVIPVILSI